MGPLQPARTILFVDLVEPFGNTVARWETIFFDRFSFLYLSAT